MQVPVLGHQFSKDEPKILVKERSFLFQVNHVKDKAELELVFTADYLNALKRLLIW